MAYDDEVLSWWRKERNLILGNLKSLEMMLKRLPKPRADKLRMKWEKRFGCQKQDTTDTSTESGPRSATSRAYSTTRTYQKAAT